MLTYCPLQLWEILQESMISRFCQWWRQVRALPIGLLLMVPMNDNQRKNEKKTTQTHKVPADGSEREREWMWEVMSLNHFMKESCRDRASINKHQSSDGDSFELMLKQRRRQNTARTWKNVTFPTSSVSGATHPSTTHPQWPLASLAQENISIIL